MFEEELEITAPSDSLTLINYLSESVRGRLAADVIPVRFVITRSDTNVYCCELGCLAGLDGTRHSTDKSIFKFVQRKVERTDEFNVVLLVPTGIGGEIGGHAGDATPVAKLLAATCDKLITHPNVVNASDINEIPQNALYVEGSVISRLLMGTLGLQPVRANRLLVLVDAHEEEILVNAAINSVNAAVATCGLQVAAIVQLDPTIKMTARYSPSGRATGRVENLNRLCEVLDAHSGNYDAVAISSIIDLSKNLHMDYFLAEGQIVNPWGGVEAMLTHTVSLLYDVPSAHSPMLESIEILNTDPGSVDPRMAAEAVSMTFLHCILKGLQRSPRIVTDPDLIQNGGVLTVADLSCLVIPDGCLGLPTLAALEQGIPVIAVRENRNLMQNDLTALPWTPGQLYVVENYWEAAGVIAALRAGIAPTSVRRPLHKVMVQRESVELTTVGGKEL